MASDAWLWPVLWLGIKRALTRKRDARLGTSHHTEYLPAHADFEKWLFVLSEVSFCFINQENYQSSIHQINFFLSSLGQTQFCLEHFYAVTRQRFFFNPWEQIMTNESMLLWPEEAAGGKLASDSTFIVKSQLGPDGGTNPQEVHHFCRRSRPPHYELLTTQAKVKLCDTITSFMSITPFINYT